MVTCPTWRDNGISQVNGRDQAKRNKTPVDFRIGDHLRGGGLPIRILASLARNYVRRRINFPSGTDKLFLVERGY